MEIKSLLQQNAEFRLRSAHFSISWITFALLCRVHTRLGKHRSLEDDDIYERTESKILKQQLIPGLGQGQGQRHSRALCGSREPCSVLGCHEVPWAKLQVPGQWGSPSTCEAFVLQHLLPEALSVDDSLQNGRHCTRPSSAGAPSKELLLGHAYL